MAVTAKWYLAGIVKAMAGSVDLDTDTFKASLHTSTYTPNQDTHDFFDDATNEAAAGSGYTAGGVTLASLSVAADATSNEIRWDCADFGWTALTKTFRYVVVRKARGGAASADELIGWIDLGADQSPAGIDFNVTVDSTGLAKVTAS